MSSEAIVSVRFQKEFSNVRLRVSTNQNLTNPIYSTVHSTSNRVAKIKITGLQPNTQYYYGVEISGVFQQKGRGMFKTFPQGSGDFSCAFASCADTGSDAEVFEHIRNLNPNFFIHMGDIHYRDISSNNKSLFHDAFDQVFSAPRQAKLYSEVPTAYIWDDHDYGPNNSNKNSPSREASCLTYRERVPHYDLPTGEGANAVYQTFLCGRVRFIMTDLRSEADPSTMTDSAEKRNMSENQIQWFFNELLKPEPVKVWVNTVPWIGSGHWGDYTFERKRIANFISENNLGGRVLILSGDMHSLAIDDGRNSDYSDSGFARIPVFQAASLDRNSSIKGGPWSSGTPFTNRGQYGVMNVTDDGGQTISIEWVGMHNNVVLVTHTMTLDGTSYIRPINSPPSTPSNFQVVGVTSSSISLSWSTVNLSTGYKLYKNDVLIYDGNNNFYQDVQLPELTSYTYKVQAYNTYGESGFVTITAQTLKETVVLPNMGGLEFWIDTIDSPVNLNSAETEVNWIDDMSSRQYRIHPTAGEGSSNRPYWTTVGNKPMIRFIGGRTFKTTVDRYEKTAEMTIFAVLALAQPAVSESPFGFTSPSNTHVRGFTRSGSDNSLASRRLTSSTGQAQLSLNGLAHQQIILATNVITPTTSTMYLNGIQSGNIQEASSELSSIHDLFIGERGGSVSNNIMSSDSRFGTLIIYNRAIQGTELAEFHNYLINKWSITQ